MTLPWLVRLSWWELRPTDRKSAGSIPSQRACEGAAGRCFSLPLPLFPKVILKNMLG